MKSTIIRLLQVLVPFLLLHNSHARPSRRSPAFGNLPAPQTTNNLNHINPHEPEKYFHEAIFDVHYDGRFTDGHLPYEHHRSSLVLLAQTCLTTMADIGVEVWLMHGTLVGWYWNRRILPWDSDVDLQISENSINHLAQYYNMSTHRFKIGDSFLRRNYLLEINPHYNNGSTEDKMNLIDARWIDTDTGLFLDLTVLRRNETAEAEGVDGAMMCKDKHHYLYDDIYPLRETTFEGVPAKVPFKYTEIIVEEYHPGALSNTIFEGHKFDDDKQEWVPFIKIPPKTSNIGVSSFVEKLDKAASQMAKGSKLEKEKVIS